MQLLNQPKTRTIKVNFFTQFLLFTQFKISLRNRNSNLLNIKNPNSNLSTADERIKFNLALTATRLRSKFLKRIR